MPGRDISFTTFNLLNFNLPGRRMYTGAGWTDAQYAAKLDFTRRMVERMEADVFGLQELWSAAALDEMLQGTRLAATHRTVTPPDHDGRGIVCAALVRPGILADAPRWITGFPDELVLTSAGDDPQQPDMAVNLRSFSRPVLHLRVQVRDDAPVIEVFVCHLKSRRPTRIDGEPWFDRDVHGPHATAIGYALSTVRRTAEAAALRVVITKIAKGTDNPVVVLGDLNDGKASNTLNVLSEQPTYLAGLSTGGRDNALYTAQVLQEYRSTRDVYYTHVYQKERESLDHILFSQEFYDNSRRRKWKFDEMIVANDHLNFDDHKDTGTTDHGIVRVGFRWSEARQEMA